MNVSSITTCFTGAPVLQDEATVLADYEVGQRLGEGAYGSVYVAKYIPSGEHFALKILQKDMLFMPLEPHDGYPSAAATAPLPLTEHDAQQQQPAPPLQLHHTFLNSSSPLGEAHLVQTVAQAVELQIIQEATVMQALEHPHVVKLYKFLNSTSAFYLIMELVDGGELFDLIISKHYFGEDEARMYFQQLISAIDYCHSNGVAHKDLKAENLLLSNDHRLLVCDFGFSAKNATHNLDDPEQTLGTGDNVALLQSLYGGAAFGTLHYMSPEAVLASMQNEYNTTSIDNPSVRSVASPLLTQSPHDSAFPVLAEHASRVDVAAAATTLYAHDGHAAASPRRGALTTSVSSSALDVQQQKRLQQQQQQVHDSLAATASLPRHGGANNKSGKHAGEGASGSGSSGSGGGGLTAIMKSLIGGGSSSSSSSHHHNNNNNNSNAAAAHRAMRKSASTDALMEQSSLRRHVMALQDATTHDSHRTSATNSDRGSPLLPHDKQRHTFGHASPPLSSPSQQQQQQHPRTAGGKAMAAAGDLHIHTRHNNNNVAATTPTTNGTAVTSPAFAAPSTSTASSTRPKHVIVDPFQQDLWSAGVILFFMLTGRLPFDGRDDEETLQLIQHNQYAFTSDEVRRISPEARALVAQMLAAEPTERPTIEQLLHNRWFAQDLNAEADFPHRDGLADALAAEQLLVRRSLTFLDFSTQHTVTANEERVLEKAFHKIDTDGYGVVTREQIRDMLTTLHGEMVSKEDVAELVGLLTGDAAADEITFEQFRAAWVTRDLAHAPYSHRSEFQLANIVATQMDEVEREVVRLLRTAFNSVDEGHTGVIQLAQLRGVFERCHMDVQEDDLRSLMRFFYEQVTQHRAGAAAAAVAAAASTGSTCVSAVTAPALTTTTTTASTSSTTALVSAVTAASEATVVASQHHSNNSNSHSGVCSSDKDGKRKKSVANSTSSVGSSGGSSSSSSDGSEHVKVDAHGDDSSCVTTTHSPASVVLHATSSNSGGSSKQQQQQQHHHHNNTSTSSLCSNSTSHACETVPISFDTFVIGIVQRDILLRHPMGRKLAAATNLAALFHSRNVTHAVHHGFLVVGLQQVVLDKLTSVPERLRLLYSDEVVSQTENIYSFRYLGASALQQGTTLLTAEPLLTAGPAVVTLSHSQRRRSRELRAVPAVATGDAATAVTAAAAATGGAVASSPATAAASLCRRRSTAASLLLGARAARHEQQQQQQQQRNNAAATGDTTMTRAVPHKNKPPTTATTSRAASPRAPNKRDGATAATTTTAVPVAAAGSSSGNAAPPQQHHHHHLHHQSQQQQQHVNGSSSSSTATAHKPASERAASAAAAGSSSGTTARTQKHTVKKAAAADTTTASQPVGSASSHGRRTPVMVTSPQLPDVLPTSCNNNNNDSDDDASGHYRQQQQQQHKTAAAAAAAVRAATAAADADALQASGCSDAVGVSPSGTFFPHRAMAFGGAGAVQLVSGVCDVDLILSPACLGYTLVRFRRIHGKTNDFHEAVAFISNLLDVERQQAIKDTMTRGESELM